MNAWQSVALAVKVCLGLQRLPCKAAFQIAVLISYFTIY